MVAPLLLNKNANTTPLLHFARKSDVELVALFCWFLKWQQQVGADATATQTPYIFENDGDVSVIVDEDGKDASSQVGKWKVYRDGDPCIVWDDGEHHNHMEGLHQSKQ